MPRDWTQYSRDRRERLNTNPDLTCSEAAVLRHERTPRFGILLPLEWKEYLHSRAKETHRSPVKYVEMLLEQDRKKRQKD